MSALCFLASLAAVPNAPPNSPPQAPAPPAEPTCVGFGNCPSAPPSAPPVPPAPPPTITTAPTVAPTAAPTTIYQGFNPPPPSPGAPPGPPGATVITQHSSVVSLVAAGSVEDYNATRIASIGAAFASAAGVSESAVTVTITSASVVIQAKIIASDANHAASISSTLSAQLTSPEAATNFFVQAGVTGVTVVSTPIVTQVQEQIVDTSTSIAPSDGSGLSGGQIALIVILCVVFVAVGAGAAVVLNNRKAAAKPIAVAAPMSTSSADAALMSSAASPSAFVQPPSHPLPQYAGQPPPQSAGQPLPYAARGGGSEDGDERRVVQEEELRLKRMRLVREAQTLEKVPPGGPDATYVMERVTNLMELTKVTALEASQEGNMSADRLAQLRRQGSAARLSAVLVNQGDLQGALDLLNTLKPQEARGEYQGLPPPSAYLWPEIPATPARASAVDKAVKDGQAVEL